MNVLNLNFEGYDISVSENTSNGLYKFEVDFAGAIVHLNEFTLDTESTNRNVIHDADVTLWLANKFGGDHPYKFRQELVSFMNSALSEAEPVHTCEVPAHAIPYKASSIPESFDTEAEDVQVDNTLIAKVKSLTRESLDILTGKVNLKVKAFGDKLKSIDLDALAGKFKPVIYKFIPTWDYYSKFEVKSRFANADGTPMLL